MPRCPSCERDASSPNYHGNTVEPTSQKEGVTVTATTGQQYWLVTCPHCDTVLGTVAKRR